MGTDDGGAAVELSLPSDSVERRADRSGREFFVVRLPEGTSVGGRDLSQGLLCATRAHEDGRRAGTTTVWLEAGTPRTVRVRTPGQHGPSSVVVGPEELGHAVEACLGRQGELAVLRHATALLESGHSDLAHEALRHLLGHEGDALPLPPVPAGGAPGRHTPAPRDTVRAYEAMGVLPAFHPLCSVDTRSPTATVPETFDFVAFDESHCVTRQYFNGLVSRARSRPAQFAGAMDEHGIGYVAAQLAHPFARADGRAVALVNGEGVDFEGEVRVIPGAPARTGGEADREVLDLGTAAIAVDRLSLMRRHGMSANEADATVAWLRERFESDLSVACDRMGAVHVSSLLRSPDAARKLLEAGMALENPATGERLRTDPDTGRLSCDVALDPGCMDLEDPAFLECCLLRVATDGDWRVSPADAVRLSSDRDGPLAQARKDARAAYLEDDWLTPRQRREASPSVEAAMQTLSAAGHDMQASLLSDECADARQAAPTSAASRPRAAGRVA